MHQNLELQFKKGLYDIAESRNNSNTKPTNDNYLIEACQQPLPEIIQSLSNLLIQDLY